MIEKNGSAFDESAFRASEIIGLPSGSEKRVRFADELQPIGTYAYVDPYYNVLQGVEAVQDNEIDDPEFKNKDWWWNHKSIRFLNAKVGMKILLLALPFLWFLFLWVSGPLAVSWLVAEFMNRTSVPEVVDFIVYIVASVLSFGWMILVLWVGPSVTNWLMSTGVGFFLKPFEKTIEKRVDEVLEDGCSELNRVTGQVRFAMGRRRFFEAPFVEFDAYVERIIQHGGIFYRLMFIHRYTQKTFNQTWLSGIEATKGEVLALWDMIQRYMDVSEPLPDVPRLEPFRHLDPVTRQYDNETNRNPRYWRDLDLETWKAGEGVEMLRRQNQYPWASRRCKLTPQLGRVSMAEYRNMRPATAWPI